MALLKGWIASGFEQIDVLILEPYPSDDLKRIVENTKTRLQLNPSPDDITHAAPARVVLAIKPQMAADILPPLAPCLPDTSLILSIMAGIKLATLQEMLGGRKTNRRIIRAMPNIPASIGYGMSVLCAGGGVTEHDRVYVEALMKTVGQIVWVEDESLMDGVTAISGSGPAYVFHLVESMAAAGVAVGLDGALAMKLARATVMGAGQMLAQLPQSAEELRNNVTSPNGTTAAALDVLMREDGLTKLMTEAAIAAKKRSQELGD